MKDKGEETGAGREPSDHDAVPTPVILSVIFIS